MTEWHSIKKDGFPKEEGKYLVTRGYSSIGSFLDLAKFTDEGAKAFYIYDSEWDYFEVYDVIAWAKVEPYKESKYNV